MSLNEAEKEEYDKLLHAKSLSADQMDRLRYLADHAYPDTPPASGPPPTKNPYQGAPGGPHVPTGSTPMTGAEFLRWAHEHGLTGEDFVVTHKGTAPAKGGATPAPADSGAAAPLTGPQLEDKVRTDYPAFAWLLDDPEIGGLLLQAESEGWTPSQFQAKVLGTNWWKTHQASVRQWMTLEHTDPKSAEAKANQKASDLRDLALPMGVGAGTDFHELARNALMFGWDDSQTRDALAALVHFRGSVTGGAEHALEQVRGMQADYAVPVSGDQRIRWARGILSGNETEQTIRGDLAERAISLYGDNHSLTKALKEGKSVREYADPYISMAANELEISPAAIDLTDAKWNKMLVNTNQNGDRIGTSLSDWQGIIRSDSQYGWDHTTGARTQAAQFSTQLRQTFGVGI